MSQVCDPHLSDSFDLQQSETNQTIFDNLREVTELFQLIEITKHIRHLLCVDLI